MSVRTPKKADVYSAILSLALVAAVAVFLAISM